jgi:hypothetical protein
MHSSGRCFSSAISGGLALSATHPTRLGVGVHYGRYTPGRTRS